jgi:hypothetical protein
MKNFIFNLAISVLLMMTYFSCKPPMPPFFAKEFIGSPMTAETRFEQQEGIHAGTETVLLDGTNKDIYFGASRQYIDSSFLKKYVISDDIAQVESQTEMVAIDLPVTGNRSSMSIELHFQDNILYGSRTTIIAPEAIFGDTIVKQVVKEFSQRHGQAAMEYSDMAARRLQLHFAKQNSFVFLDFERVGENIVATTVLIDGRYGKQYIPSRNAKATISGL